MKIERRRVQFHTKGESRTKQSMKDETDINNIMRKHYISHYNQNPGSYGDFTQATDFHTAQNLVIQAHEQFMDLPSHIRKKFNNSPSQFIDFIEDDKNYDEAKKLGLIQEKPITISDQINTLTETIKSQTPSSSPKSSQTSKNPSKNS